MLTIDNYHVMIFLGRQERSKIMNEKLFTFFSGKVGGAEIDGREYAFCHPPKLEIDGIGELVVTCTAVDKEGNFYDLWWFQSACSRPLVKRIGKYEELPVKNIEEVISYLEQDRLLTRFL